jgi:rhodanese-related sulfurtransferase
MLPRMSRPALLAIALAAWALPGCDVREEAGAALGAVGVASFREVPAPEARRLAEGGDALLLQVRGEDPPARRIPGARLVGGDEAPEEAAGGRRVVVLAEAPELGFRLGARLARAGATRVAVVSGGLPAWAPGEEE